MCDDGNGFFCAVFHHYISSFHQRAASVCHVVHDDRNLAPHITDQSHPGDLIRSSSLFVDERELQVERVRYACRTLRASRIW